MHFTCIFSVGTSKRVIGIIYILEKKKCKRKRKHCSRNGKLPFEEFNRKKLIPNCFSCIFHTYFWKMVYFIYKSHITAFKFELHIFICKLEDKVSWQFFENVSELIFKHFDTVFFFVKGRVPFAFLTWKCFEFYLEKINKKFILMHGEFSKLKQWIDF